MKINFEQLKKFHNIKTDNELFDFLMNYQETKVLQLTPNEVRFLKFVLSQYDPDYDEHNLKNNLLKKINEIK